MLRAWPPDRHRASDPQREPSPLIPRTQLSGRAIGIRLKEGHDQFVLHEESNPYSAHFDPEKGPLSPKSSKVKDLTPLSLITGATPSSTCPYFPSKLFICIVICSLIFCLSSSSSISSTGVDLSSITLLM